MNKNKFFKIGAFLIILMGTSLCLVFAEVIEPDVSWALPPLDLDLDYRESGEFVMPFFLDPYGERQPDFLRLSGTEVFSWRSDKIIIEAYPSWFEDGIVYRTEVLFSEYREGLLYIVLSTVAEEFQDEEGEFRHFTLAVFTEDGAGHLYNFEETFARYHEEKGFTVSGEVSDIGDCMLVLAQFDQGYSSKYDYYYFYYVGENELYLIDSLKLNENNHIIHPPGTENSASYTGEYSFIFYNNEYYEFPRLQIKHSGKMYDEVYEQMIDMNMWAEYAYDYEISDYNFFDFDYDY